MSSNTIVVYDLSTRRMSAFVELDSTVGSSASVSASAHELSRFGVLA